MLIAPILVRRSKMMVFFHCIRKILKTFFHCFSIVLYCLKTIEQWDFQKKKKSYDSIFANLMDLRHQKKYADQFLGPPDKIYKNHVIALQREISDV